MVSTATAAGLTAVGSTEAAGSTAVDWMVVGSTAAASSTAVVRGTRWLYGSSLGGDDSRIWIVFEEKAYSLHLRDRIWLIFWNPTQQDRGQKVRKGLRAISRVTSRAQQKDHGHSLPPGSHTTV